MAEHKKIFLPIGEFIPDPPSVSLSQLSECEDYIPYAQGMVSIKPSREETPEMTDANFTKTLGANAFEVSTLHVHPTRQITTDGDGVDTISFNVADLFIAGTYDIALREDFLDQMGLGSDTRNVTKTALGTYGQGDTAPLDWSMTSWSWDCVIATNYSDPVQRFVYAGTGTERFTDMLADGTTSHNADSIRAAFVATLGRHVVLANIWVDETDAAYYFGSITETFQPDLIWWSATDDETIFGDEDTFPEDNTGWQGLWDNHGAITGLARSGDRALVVFKQNAIYLMELSGAEELFHFTLISDNVGTIWAKSIVTVGRDVYFISSTGKLCRLTGGTSLEYIGKGRVDGFFGTLYSPFSSTMSQMPYFCDAAYSAPWNSIFFQYKSNIVYDVHNVPQSYQVNYLVYNIDLDQFSTVVSCPTVDVSLLTPGVFPGSTPCVAYSYDKSFYPIDAPLDEAMHPQIVEFNPFGETA